MKKIRLYDESAKSYHVRYMQIQQTKYQAIVTYLIEGPVLDVGIGTGIGLTALLDYSPVIGVDGSVEMLRITKEQIKDFKPRHESILLVVASAEMLPFRDHVFPTVVSITVLQNLTEISQSIQELERAIQADGILAVTALAKTLSTQEIEDRLQREFAILTRFHNLANEDNGLIIRVLKE
ncbi:MAG: class I SAM-dependent methyltransferase [Promethearchaeota archaeon]